jgi:hypothetical protein
VIRHGELYREQEKSEFKLVLDTGHFECETYREVLFRFTTQKILELTFFIITANGLDYIYFKI